MTYEAGRGFPSPTPGTQACLHFSCAGSCPTPMSFVSTHLNVVGKTDKQAHRPHTRDIHVRGVRIRTRRVQKHGQTQGVQFARRYPSCGLPVPSTDGVKGLGWQTRRTYASGSRQDCHSLGSGLRLRRGVFKTTQPARGRARMERSNSVSFSSL